MYFSHIFVFLWLTSNVTMNTTMQSHIYVKSCDYSTLSVDMLLWLLALSLSVSHPSACQQIHMYHCPLGGLEARFVFTTVV